MPVGPEESTLSTLVWGLLIGAGAGVVSSFILGVFHAGKTLVMRCNQVRYLRILIVEDFTRIKAPADIPNPSEGAPPTRGEKLRPPYFEQFMKSMAVAVDHRTSALSNSQMFKLHHAMMLSRKHEEFARFVVRTQARLREEELPDMPGTGLPTGINFYRTIYGYFAAIKWLRLPEDMSDIES